MSTITPPPTTGYKSLDTLDRGGASDFGNGQSLSMKQDLVNRYNQSNSPVEQGQILAQLDKLSLGSSGGQSGLLNSEDDDEIVVTGRRPVYEPMSEEVWNISRGNGYHISPVFGAVPYVTDRLLDASLRTLDPNEDYDGDGTPNRNDEAPADAANNNYVVTSPLTAAQAREAWSYAENRAQWEWYMGQLTVTAAGVYYRGQVATAATIFDIIANAPPVNNAVVRTLAESHFALIVRAGGLGNFVQNSLMMPSPNP